MKAIVSKPTFVLFFMLACMTAKCQWISYMGAKIEDTGDCKYRVHGVTRGSASQITNFTVQVEMDWTLTGYYLGQAFSYSDSDTDTGSSKKLEAEIDVIKDFPTFDDWEVAMTSKHTVSTQPLAGTSQTTYNFSCQFFVDNNDGCTEVIAKAVGDTPCNHSPIVLDMDRNGFDFSGPEGAVAFDLYATGEPIVIQWVRPESGDAFLFRDVNGNGIVDDGSELFGNGTPLILEGDSPAPNGFVALAQFDNPVLGGNDDGLIDEDDLVWSELGLWLDWDANGISDPDELVALDESVVESLEIIPRETNWWDEHLNWLRFLAWAQGQQEESYLMVDVFFREVK